MSSPAPDPSKIAPRLRQDVEAPGLWERIDARLEREASARRRRLGTGLCVALAAMLLALTLLRGGLRRPPSALLDSREIHTFSDEQRRLESEVDRLQAELRQLRSRRPEHELVLGQMVFLDSNIALCRDAALRNAGNAAVQRSLLNSYRQKVILLKGLLGATS